MWRLAEIRVHCSAAPDTESAMTLTETTSMLSRAWFWCIIYFHPILCRTKGMTNLLAAPWSGQVRSDLYSGRAGDVSGHPLLSFSALFSSVMNWWHDF